MIQLKATQPVQPTEGVDLSSNASTMEPISQPNDMDIMTQVMGSRSRYIKGLGPLPKLSVVGGTRVSSSSSYHHVNAETIVELQEKLTSTKDELNSTKEELAKNKEELARNKDELARNNLALQNQTKRVDILFQRLSHFFPGFSFEDPTSQGGPS